MVGIHTNVGTAEQQSLLSQSSINIYRSTFRQVKPFNNQPTVSHCISIFEILQSANLLGFSFLAQTLAYEVFIMVSSVQIFF